MPVSYKIKEFLKRKHMTQPYLSELTGINKSTLIGKFYRDNFEANDLVKIAEAMDCKLAFVKDGEVFILE